MVDRLLPNVPTATAPSVAPASSTSSVVKEVLVVSLPVMPSSALPPAQAREAALTAVFLRLHHAGLLHGTAAKLDGLLPLASGAADTENSNPLGALLVSISQSQSAAHPRLPRTWRDALNALIVDTHEPDRIAIDLGPLRMLLIRSGVSQEALETASLNRVLDPVLPSASLGILHLPPARPSSRILLPAPQHGVGVRTATLLTHNQESAMPARANRTAPILIGQGVDIRQQAHTVQLSSEGALLLDGHELRTEAERVCVRQALAASDFLSVEFERLPAAARARAAAPILQVFPEAYALFPVALRAQRELLKLAAKYAPEMIDAAPAHLRADRKLAQELISQCGAAFGYLPAFADDRELCQLAIRDAGMMFKFASPRLRADLELVRTAIDRYPNAYFDSLPPARDTKRVFLDLLEKHHCVMADEKQLPRDVEQDPELLIEAASVAPTRLAQHLLNNQALAIAAARRNPLILRELPALLPLVAAQPEIVRQFHALEVQLKAAGIEHPERIHSLKALEEIIANRLLGRRADDKRPLALLLYARADGVGALRFNAIAELTKAYHVRYVEVGTDVDALAQLQAASAEGGAQLLMLSAHGNRDGLLMGDWQPAGWLDISDADKLQGVLGPAVKKGGTFVLAACRNGAGRTYLRNAANMMADSAPHATIFAATRVTLSHPSLDAQGFYVEPRFWRGKAETYKIEPRLP